VTPSTAATSPAREAAAAVLETVPLVMRAIRTRMREGRPEAISIPQFRALIFIRRHPGTDLSAVASQVGTSLAAASELVARLVRQGLVVRETDPGSRRRIRLTLSDVGLADLEVAELRTTAWLVDLVARLDADRARALVGALADLRSLVQGALAEDAVAGGGAPRTGAPEDMVPRIAGGERAATTAEVP
jgi:DNA-binding MarR family transcriptional regulator